MNVKCLGTLRCSYVMGKWGLIHYPYLAQHFPGRVQAVLCLGSGPYTK